MTLELGISEGALAGIEAEVVMRVIRICFWAACGCSRAPGAGPGTPESEQNVRQVLQVADVAFVLENGRIVMSGTGVELVRDPKVKEAYLGF